MADRIPETMAREVLTTCANCDQCRDLLAEAPCQFFPRLFTIADRIRERGDAPASRELADLIDMCNSCGQCPCGSIQTAIRRAKDAFVDRDGLPLAVRLIERIRLVGRLCGTFPAITDALMRSAAARPLKRAVGIHPDRRMPRIPSEGFDVWAKRQGLGKKPKGGGRRVAYFVGCTARYYFPQVAIATVEVLRANGVAVWVPPQDCCGMPAHLEGDRGFTHRLAATNLPILAEAVTDGFDVVTACPTCSFAFKTVLARGARFSEENRADVRRRFAEVGGDVARLKARLEAEMHAPTGRVGSAAADFTDAWVLNQILCRSYAGEGEDDGCFAGIDPRLRITVAAHTHELGEYLRKMAETGDLRPVDGLPPERLAYFPPCHLREQGIGRPWFDLLSGLPGARLEVTGRVDDCCGLGGLMGFKETFHHASLAMGRGLMARTAALAPDGVLTECLGCRVQFEQMGPWRVRHPVELLAEALRR
jgi:glycerol-3-phosphate dehydrogenase subunit C